MSLYGALYPKSDVDTLYLSRQKGGRGLISCEMCVKTEENNLAWYLKNSNERLLAGVRGIGILNSDAAKEKRVFKQERQNATLNRWKEKKMHGQFLRDMPETVDKDKIWEWTRKSDLKIGTEALIFAAQEQALRTNYVKFNIDKSVDSPLCRLCSEKGETINHIICECNKLAQKEYKRRHDNIARLVHWKLCCKYDIDRSEKWYEHQPERVVENESYKILWDMTIQCDHIIAARKPDIVVVEKKNNKAIIVDIASPWDYRVHEKEGEKVEKYQELKREIKNVWGIRNVEVVPIVVGALGGVSKRLDGWLAKLGIAINTGLLQKTALLGTARILRKVLEN